MTLQRRPVGRGRWVAAISALIVLVGCVLPWLRAGGSDGIPALTVNAFEGSGILVFLAALATLALVSLPFALGDAAMTADPWWAYAAIGGVAFVALLLRVLEAFGIEGGVALIMPDRGPGTWITAIGVVGLLFAAAEMYGQRRA